MSVATGTATDYDDLLDRLVTFLTTDATLTGLGQNWTKLHDNSTPYTFAGDTVDYEVDLKAPGLSTTEAIYVQLQAFHNAGYANWRMRGATGYNSGQPWSSQPGASPDTFISLWSTSIPYTFVANGQRAIVIAQIGTVFETAYLGKFLPYGQPSQYPYPLYIGGTGVSQGLLYADTSGNHSAFFDPIGAYAYQVDGSWAGFRNINPAGGAGGGSPQVTFWNVWPYIHGGGASQPAWMDANLDGSYPLFPVRLEVYRDLPASSSSSPQPNALGELDGVFFIPGVSLTSGTTITVGSDTYLVAQNCFRTGLNNFMAIKEA